MQVNGQIESAVFLLVILTKFGFFRCRLFTFETRFWDLCFETESANFACCVWQHDCIDRRMDPLLVTAAGALRNHTEALEITANNLANQGTSGFRANRSAYSQIWSEVQAQMLGAESELTPFAVATTDEVWIDFQAGSLVTTNNETDVAIHGDGFLVVNTPRGSRLTRSGDLHVSPQGQLVTAEGFKLETTTAQPYRIEPRLPIEIKANGTVLQNGTELATLRFVQPSAPKSLVKDGSNLFRSPEPSEQWKTASGSIWQGKLERSNFEATEGTVQLVELMRHVEMMQKAIQMGGEMNRRSVEELAKTGA
jgi:flagellar basal-body rod protein FlgF